MFNECLEISFASLISPSKIILFEKLYRAFDTVFHHQMKHLEVRQKYSAARRIFNSHLVMKHCVLCLIYYLQNCNQSIPSENFLLLFSCKSLNIIQKKKPTEEIHLN